MKHSTKVSVDLRGFHLFDNSEESSDEEDNNKSVKTAKKLKSKIKHAKKMSVDLQGYHLFNDGESSEDEEEGTGAVAVSAPPANKKMHDKKISVDLRGFDLFYESDEDEDSNDEDEVGAVQTEPKKAKQTKDMAPSASFKKVESQYLNNDEDDDLKGFHLFDEYNSDDEDDEVIKLHELEKDQLTVLVRNLLVENAILKDAASRARSKLDSRKTALKEAQQSKIAVISVLAAEMNRMRDDIRSLSAGTSGASGKAATIG